ncbi:hypothetical protein BDV18DRAFT_158330 [Aspergillus unguis]
MRLLPVRLSIQLAFLAIFGSWAVGEPVQYCRYGQQNFRGGTANFCLGLATYYNASSTEYDVYVSIHARKSSVSDALGWVAVGTGSMMAGSLMFIVYGDPSSPDIDPTLSIRTIDGHHQPRVLTLDDTEGVSFGDIKATWTSADLVNRGDTQGVIAEVSFICYSCGKWPGDPILMDTKAQPWIWAFDERTEFEEYTEDVYLKAHAHEAKNGGWGRFYVDMARSISNDSSAASAPSIQPGVTEIGAWSIPGGWSWMDTVVRMHGFLMSAAFLLLYPAGIVAMRSGTSKSFQYHWIIQLIASIFVLVGAAIGLLRAHKISSPHHIIGLVVTVSSFIQIVLGWRHHVLFVQIRRRQWASYGHIWLGRLFFLLGWTNVITGLLMTGRGWSLVSLAASLISIVALALIGWVWFSTRQRKHPAWEETPLYDLQPTRDDYFAVAADEDESESESSSQASQSAKERLSETK